MANSIDSDKARAELDLALTPPSSQPSGLHDFSVIPPESRPTEINLINDSDKATTPDVLGKFEIKREEDYTPDPRIIANVLHLIRNGNKKVGPVKFDLEYVQSEDQLRRILKNHLALGNLNEAEYEKLAGYLGEEKPPEVILDNEEFAVPKELIFYVNSLVQNGIGPTMLLDALKEENISKDDVLTTLFDSFYSLKILSEEQYRKALSILGETEEEINKSIDQKPKFFRVAARTTKDDVAEFEEEIKKTEVPTPPTSITPEPTSDPIITPIDTTDVTPPTPEELDSIDVELNSARESYATQYIAWKNKLREKKRWYAKIVSDLGIEKQMPLADRPDELQNAEKAYILAKKNKAKAILDKLTISEEGSRYHIYEQTEKERDALAQQILDSIPPIEKGRILKALEGWSRVPRPARIALTTTLMVGVGMAFGTVAVAGAGGTILYKGARSGLGATIGQTAALVADMEMTSRSDARRREAGSKHSTGIAMDLSNFEEREQELMRFNEEEANQIKRNRLKKAGVMMAVGAGVNLGTDLLAGGLAGHVPGTISRPNAGALNDTPKTGGGTKSFDGVRVRPTASHEVSQVDTSVSKTTLTSSHETNPMSSVDKPTVGGVEVPGLQEVSRVEVGVSTKGLEQDLLYMKDELRAQYGTDLDKMPQQVREFIKTPYRELSIKYGFFDPKTGQSGMSLSGGKLVMDENGFSYEHGTQKDILFDAKSNTTQKFGEIKGNEMFVPKTHSEIPVGNEQETFVSGVDDMSGKGSSPDYVDSTQHIVGLNQNTDNLITPLPEPTSSTEVPKLSPDVKLETPPIIYKGSVVELVNEGSGRIIKIGDQTIAHEQAFGAGKILTLDDKFQDGSRYQDIRSAFVESFEKNTLADQIGETPTAVRYI
jgi:hypothetical protein